jgi:Tol biopolymer transport system component
MRRVMKGPRFTPDWHPDGSRFVFHSTRIPQYLFTVGADGPPIRQLTGPDSPNPDLENTVVGRWRPDGNRILFSVEAGDQSGIYTMDSDGSSVQKLVAWSLMPDWFPSGKRITYVSWDQSVEDLARRKQIYVARADGTDRRKLTDLDDSRDILWPSVSPDGQRIAFVYNDQVYLMTADGTNVRQITGGSGFAATPTWSPDGKTILFFVAFP